MTSENPIATYCDVYFYFELYEDYIQIHQENLIIIPYPHGIENDGAKIYFKDLKSIYFYKELKIYGDGETDAGKVGWFYECKLKGKNTTFKPIKNIIHKDLGISQEKRNKEYREFIQLLLQNAQPYQAKIYTASGLTNRIDKALPFLKLSKMSAIKFAGTMLIIPIIEFLLDVFSLYDVDLGLFYIIGFSCYAVMLLAFLASRYWKKKISWEEVKEEYLPLKS